MEFKNKGISYITSDNLIFLAHFEFAIFDLIKNELIFEDKTPFGPKKRQVSFIEYVENKGLIFLVTFNGDFVIYKIDQKSHIVTKTHTYIQKGNWYCCDASSRWIKDEHLIAFVEKGSVSTLRKISFSGEVHDYNLNTFVGGCGRDFYSHNNQIVSIKNELKLIDTSSPDSLKFENISSYFPELDESIITSIFNDGVSNDIYCLTVENETINVYKREKELVNVLNYKRKYPESYLFVKFINGHIFIAEEYDDSFLREYKVFIRSYNIEKEFDLTDFHKKDYIFTLCSFNEHFISVYSSRKVCLFDIDKM